MIKAQRLLNNHSETQPPASTNAAIRRLFLAACWLAFAFMFVKYALVLPFAKEGVDFAKHYNAAVHVLHGRLPCGNDYLSFSTPMFTVWIYLFLAAFSHAQAAWIWNICNTFYILAALGMLIRYCHPSPSLPPSPSPDQAARRWLIKHWPSAVALMLAAFAPLFLQLPYGNIETLNLALIVLFISAMLRDADAVAGLALGVLCLVKLLPGLLLIPLALAGKKRAVAFCLAVLAVYGALLIATGGWRWDWILLTQVLQDLPYKFSFASSSLVCIGSYLFAPSLMENKAHFDAASRIIALTVFAATILTLLASWRACRRNWRDSVALCSLSVPLLTPLLEYHHYIWTIPAYVFLFRDFAEGASRRRYFAVSLALWAVIFAAGYWNVLRMRVAMPPTFYATLATAALWAMTAGRLIAKSSAANHDDNAAASMRTRLASDLSQNQDFT